ncbi:MAG: response regulator [Chlorobiaceae bacterium]|nr:response regulator [Chlorobiaceae bacterium]
MPFNALDFNLFKDFPEPVFVMAPDGTILAANCFFTSRFNRLHEHILGCNVFELLAEINAPPEVIANRRNKSEEVLRIGRYVAFDDPMDGKFWRSSIYPVFDANEQISMLLVFLQNVTELRLAQTENEDFRAKIDYALESSHVSVWSLDIENNVVQRTREHDRIFGYDTLLPRWSVETFFDHLHPDDMTMVRKQYEVSMANQSDFNLECRIRRADGETRWINLMGTFRFAKPESSRYVAGIVVDITEKKLAALELEQLQAQLQHSQKMDLLGQLAGGIAHDFNNSLTAIIGHIELALCKIDSSHPVAENLRNAHQSATNSAHLTRQLLGFARKQMTRPKVISLNQETESLMPMLGRLISAPIRCVWKPGYDDTSVFIDPSQLDQVLSNLCINARDAIEMTGTITISSSTVHLEKSDCGQGHPCQTPGEYVLLSVSDTGSGIDSKTLPHIFEPFFTTKPVGKGTGLGLSTVYGIVRQNNGYIDCQTELAKGTTFSIYFPRHQGNAAAIDSRTPEITYRTATETILLVEDESSVLNILSEALEEKGFEVLAALDAESAIVIAEIHKEKIKLLVTDMILPGMNGRELSTQVKESIPCVKLLFMSGFAFAEPWLHGLSTMPVNHIRKPFTIQDFITKVSQVLLQERDDHE